MCQRLAGEPAGRRPYRRKLPSQLANRLISRVTRVPLHDYGCALKAYRASTIRELHLYGESTGSSRRWPQRSGARTVELPVNHRRACTASPSTGSGAPISVLLDLLWIRFMMRFSQRPMHAFGGLAMVLLLSGLAILAGLSAEKLLTGADIGGRPLLLLGALLTLLGVQLLATGLLGELLIRIWHEPKGRKQYLLDERVPQGVESETGRL